MKLLSSLLITISAIQLASAHCMLSLAVENWRSHILPFPLDIWTTLITGSTTSTAAVRLPVNNSPVTDVTSNDITCNVNPGKATETVDVPAGSTLGFKLDNTIYHQGPAAIYLGKAPSDAASWDGSGANWFKVCAERFHSFWHEAPYDVLNR